MLYFSSNITFFFHTSRQHNFWRSFQLFPSLIFSHALVFLISSCPQTLKEKKKHMVKFSSNIIFFSHTRRQCNFLRSFQLFPSLTVVYLSFLNLFPFRQQQTLKRLFLFHIIFQHYFIRYSQIR